MRAVLCVTALAALSGCGGSDADRIEQAVRDYHRAYADADTERACELTADEFWDDVPTTCEEFIAQLGPLADPDATKRLTEGEYEVTIQGDEATAQGTNLGIFTLRKVDGDWKLTSSR